MYPSRNVWTSGAQGTGSQLRCTSCGQSGHADARNARCPRGTRTVKTTVRRENIGQAPWENGPRGPQDVRFGGMIEEVQCSKCGLYGHENARSAKCPKSIYYKETPPASSPTLPKLTFPSNLPPPAPNAPRPMHASYIPFGPAQEAQRAKQCFLMGKSATNCNIGLTNTINKEFYFCISCKLRVHVSNKATRCPHLR